MLALPVTVLNISAAVGRIFIGFAADKLGPVNALFVAIALSGLTQLVVWMFVTTYAGIVSPSSPDPAFLLPLFLLVLTERDDSYYVACDRWYSQSSMGSSVAASSRSCPPSRRRSTAWNASRGSRACSSSLTPPVRPCPTGYQCAT